MDAKQMFEITEPLQRVLNNQNISAENQIKIINQNYDLNEDLLKVNNRLKKLEEKSHNPIPFLRYSMIFSFVIYILFLIWLVILQKL